MATLINKCARKLLLASFILAGFSSCISVDDTPFDEKLSAYLAKDLPVVEMSSDKFAAYFDFSGVYVAYQDQNTAQTFNGLTQKVTANAARFDVYKLANQEITELSVDFTPAQQFQQLHDSRQQGQLYAPIEKTLEKIVSEGRSALLVTDFEEYTPQGVIYRQAYAAPYFEQWLKTGGDITFFVTDYKEGNIDKHLYYVVFDHNYQNHYHDLLRLVEDGLSGLPENYERFTMGINSSPMAYNYPTASQGGTYRDENGDDVVTSSVEDGTADGFFMLDSLGAESYVFGNSWEDIVENASFQTRANGISVPFTHLFRNLFIDLSQKGSYQINQLAVRVSDVQDDFDKFSGYYTAINNQPKVENEDGEIYLDFAGVEKGEPYYGDDGNILPEFDYTRGPGQITEIHDMLEFDNDLFLSTRQTDPARVELGIKLRHGFNGQVPGLDPTHLLRIDIVIADADICELDRIDELFYWPGNDCLSAAIKSVLQDLKPIGKPLYSYFVRTL